MIVITLRDIVAILLLYRCLRHFYTKHKLQTIFHHFNFLKNDRQFQIACIMHLETKNYSVNKIIDKRTLSQSSARSMSLSSCQQSVNVVQMFNNQTNNAFDVLRNRSSTSTSQKTAQKTQTQIST